MASLGNFFVTIGSKFDAKGMTKARSSINAVGKAVGAFALAFGGAMAFAVKKASDLEETTSKFNVVFRGVQKEANAMSKVLVDSYGVSREESKRFLSSMQDLLVPMGFARDKAADLSNEMVQLSVDIGSFNNMPTEQVMRDITSALNGMPLPMRKYGVNVTQARIKQEALNLGLSETGKELSVQTKAMAVFALIQKDSADAQGDFQRTSDGLANSLKIMKARFDTLVADIGTSFIPTAKKATNLIANEILPKTQEWIKDGKNLEGVIRASATGVKFFINTIIGLVGTLNIVRLSITAITDKMVVWMAHISKVGAALTGNFAAARQFGQIAKEANDKATESADALSQAIVNTGDIIGKVNEFEIESFIEKEDAIQEKKDEISEQEEIRLQNEEKILIDRLERVADIRKEVGQFVADEEERLFDQKMARIDKGVDIAVDAAKDVADLEVFTARSVADSIKESLKRRLKDFIALQLQEMAAARLKAVAIALSNATITFGVAAAQVGIVLAQFAAGTAAMAGLQSLDRGGVVDAPAGKPVLVQALGGEKFLGRQSIGDGAGGITVNIHNPLITRSSAREVGNIIADTIFSKVNRTRRV